jgi:hypothetical protein
MLDGRMLYFTSAATFRQLLEVLLKDINKDTKRLKERKKGCRGLKYKINHSLLNFDGFIPLIFLDN